MKKLLSIAGILVLLAAMTLSLCAPALASEEGSGDPVVTEQDNQPAPDDQSADQQEETPEDPQPAEDPNIPAADDPQPAADQPADQSADQPMEAMDTMGTVDQTEEMNDAQPPADDPAPTDAPVEVLEAAVSSSEEPEVVVDGSSLATKEVKYLDADDEEQTVKANVLVSTDAGYILTAGTYVAEGNVTINGTVELSGQVNLILADDAVLTITASKDSKSAITGASDAVLTIYSQSARTGKMACQGGKGAAGISCSLNVVSGNITAAGGEGSYGITGKSVLVSDAMLVTADDVEVVFEKDADLASVLANKTTVVIAPDPNYCRYYEEIPVTAGEVHDITGTKDAHRETNEYSAQIVVPEDTDLTKLLGLTDEEVAKGVNVWLEITHATDTSYTADKVVIGKARGEYKIGQYIAIALYEKIGDGEAKQITELTNDLKISLILPSTLQKAGLTFEIISVKEVEKAADAQDNAEKADDQKTTEKTAEIITATCDETTFTLTFETKLFSTSAIAYKTTETPDDPDDPDTTTYEYYEDLPVTAGTVTDVTGDARATKETNEYSADIATADSDLATALGLTSDEVAQGVNVWLEISAATNTMSTANKTLITDAKGDYKIGKYIDVKLFKKVGTNEPVQIPSPTNSKLSVSLILPTTLRVANLDLQVLSVVGTDSTTTFPATYDTTTYKMTYETNQFTDSAIIYKTGSSTTSKLHYEDLPVTAGAVTDITGDSRATAETNTWGADIATKDEDLAALMGISDTDKATGVNVWLEVKSLSSGTSTTGTTDTTGTTGTTGTTTTTSTISDDEKTLIASVKGTYSIGQYLDISLYQKVGTGEATQVHTLTDKMKVSIVVPTSLQKTGRSFEIIGIKDGTASVITVTADETTHTLTFETDHFSTYALAYSDSGTSGTSGTSGSTSPTTGDTNTPALWLGLMAVCAAGITGCVIALRAKKRSGAKD